MKGLMVDCSRNAVMNLTALKRFVKLISALGYDTLMLYTEDTYEVDGEPYFGHQRGRFSKAELKEADAFCRENGVELVPCIQTLAHLNAMFKWINKYGCINDTADILLADDDRTYKLIDEMLATLAECFTTRKIHIGMDEAYMVGLGKYRDKHGDTDRFEIINRHLHKVCDIADKYGFKPMIWSDMFCKLAVSSSDYYSTADLEAIRKKANLPENLTLVYWDYYSTDYNRYSNMIEKNKAFGRPVAFAGGAWTWKGFAPGNQFSFDTTLPAVKACRDRGVKDIFFTMWGDNGGECSRFAVLPALCYSAELLEGNENMSDAKARLKAVTGMEFDDFMLLDKLDNPTEKLDYNASKYLLYCDPFMGAYDSKITCGVNGYYKELYKKLSAIKATDDYKPYFESAAALADVLSVKAELGIKTRAAYLAGDTKALKCIAENDYTAAIEKLRAFHTKFRKFWFFENKPHGFDVQDIRLGGLIMRLESCRDRLLEFCDDTEKKIPELSEPVLEDERSKSWDNIVTANVI